MSIPTALYCKIIGLLAWCGVSERFGEDLNLIRNIGNKSPEYTSSYHRLYESFLRIIFKRDVNTTNFHLLYTVKLEHFQKVLQGN
jgi:hypothetical protein